jgi:hypothetical protein
MTSKETFNYTLTDSTGNGQRLADHQHGAAVHQL